MECEVCIKPFNVQKNKCIECFSCEHKACAQCYERFILSQKGPAGCMACKVPWSKKFLIDNFTKRFVTQTYKHHQRETMCEHEMAQLPDAQDFLEDYRWHNRLKLEKISFQAQMKTHRETIQILKEQIEHERCLLNAIDCEVYDIDKILRRPLRRQNHSIKFKCPIDDCVGYVDEKWFCQSCENHVCPSCMEKWTSDHECNEDTKKSVSLLRFRSKPCPKCKTMISKIDGCDQMWCTLCHATFDWETERIIVGHIHNPHYNDWMRQEYGYVPRHPDDIENSICLQNMHREWLQMGLNNDIDLPEHIHEYITNCFKTTINEIMYERSKLVRFDEPDTLDLRLKFLDHELDQEEFKDKVYKLYTKYEKLNEYRQVLEMVIMAISHCLREFLTKHKENSYHADTESLESLRIYANSCLNEYSRIYLVSGPIIFIAWSGFSIIKT